MTKHAEHQAAKRAAQQQLSRAQQRTTVQQAADEAVLHRSDQMMREAYLEEFLELRSYDRLNSLSTLAKNRGFSLDSSLLLRSLAASHQVSNDRKARAEEAAAQAEAIMRRRIAELEAEIAAIEKTGRF